MDRRRATPARQQRAVDIEAAQHRRIEEALGQDMAVAVDRCLDGLVGPRGLTERSATFRRTDVIEALAGPNVWNHRTIRTLLARLVEKGALRFEVDGKSQHALLLDLRFRTAHASGGLLPTPGTAVSMARSSERIAICKSPTGREPTIPSATLGPTPVTVSSSPKKPSSSGERKP